MLLDHKPKKHLNYTLGMRTHEIQSLTFIPKLTFQIVNLYISNGFQGELYATNTTREKEGHV